MIEYQFLCLIYLGVVFIFTYFQCTLSCLIFFTIFRLFNLNATLQSVTLGRTLRAWVWRCLGCEECYCDYVGSYNSSCVVTSGQCHCRPGVSGLKCDQCIAHYYGFSDSGCTGALVRQYTSISPHCAKCIIVAVVLNLPVEFSGTVPETVCRLQC